MEVLMSKTHTFTVARRLDREPGGLEDRAKVTQVRVDFSRMAAPRSRPAGRRSGGLSPVRTAEERRQGTD